jgi:hypothetical protein
MDPQLSTETLKNLTKNIYLCFSLYHKISVDDQFSNYKQMKYLFYMFIGVWEGYCVGQQQDSEEFLRKIMEEVRRKCFR